MEIRIATADDIPAIDGLVRAAYPRLLAPDYSAGVLDVAIPLMAQTQPALMAEQGYFVAVCDGRIVGGAGWTRVIPGTKEAAQGRGNIRKLVLDHCYLRQGVATALMERVHADARRAGMTWMHVLSTRTAVPFYAAQGYSGSAEVAVPLGASDVRFPAVEMTLTFDESA